MKRQYLQNPQRVEYLQNPQRVEYLQNPQRVEYLQNLPNKVHTTDPGFLDDQPTLPIFVCTNEQTRKEFNRLRPSKAAGPDGISPKVLKMCSSQLCEILCTIFNLSFQSGVVPDIWKSSCIVPVPKNNKVGSVNDLRPVALTSVASKTCERIVLPQLKSFIHDSLDPFQFAYQSNRSCEDALLVTINDVTSHLDSKLSVKKKTKLVE